jgi:putative AdoMet-dependent methyltransferase
MRAQLSSSIGAYILAHVPLDEEMAVMDFGAGTGLLTAHVAPGVKMIAAVDTSEAMLEKLVAKPEFHGIVTAVCQDIMEQPLESHYDLIISAMAMHHIEDTAGLFATFSKHLRPGGRIALADLDKEDGTFHPPGSEGIFHHGFVHDDLKTIIGNNGFTDIHFHPAHTIERDGKSFPIFLVTAVRSAP